MLWLKRNNRQLWWAGRLFLFCAIVFANIVKQIGECDGGNGCLNEIRKAHSAYPLSEKRGRIKKDETLFLCLILQNEYQRKKGQTVFTVVGRYPYLLL